MTTEFRGTNSKQAKEKNLQIINKFFYNKNDALDGQIFPEKHFRLHY